MSVSLPLLEKIKELRETYDPRKLGSRIRILFVGGSPPKQNNVEFNKVRFFYNRNTRLYFATFRAFNSVFGIDEQEFLEYFMGFRCYLYDIFEVPGKKINSVQNIELEEAKRSLGILFEKIGLSL